jgi:UDP-N-acetylmuramoylalanine--D-glutamate ligase
MTGPLEWPDLRVVVAGIGVSGFAAADALLERGARVVVLDAREGPAQRERGIVLETLGADIRLGAQAVTALPAVGDEAAQLLIVSPGWGESDPVVRDALAAGLPVWGEAELAWRLRPLDRAAPAAAPWLTVTGTRGKATTTTLLANMLTAAGHRAVAIGQAGTSLLEAVLHPDPYDVIAVQLSTFQLRWSQSLRPYASVCLNVAGTDLTDGSRAERGRVYRNTEVACVYNAADPVTEELVREADVIEGCRAIGFTLGVPAVSMLGLVEDVLCDRAFVEERRTSAAELGTLEDTRTAAAGVLGAHFVADALAAAAMARSFGVPASAVRDGLRAYLPLRHRLNPVGLIDQVTWVDDAAATDPVAAAAGLASFEKVVWVAGGPTGPDAEGLAALVGPHTARLRGAVLLDPAAPATLALREALRRHAPDVPVLEVDLADTGSVPVMETVVSAADRMARPGDTVLLSPGAAPDPVASLEELGLAFAVAVRALEDSRRPDGTV